ncbi:WPP domain-interacting protein 1 [Linum perenne]
MSNYKAPFVRKVMDLADESGTALRFVGDDELTPQVTATSLSSLTNAVGDGNGKLEADGLCLNAVHGSQASEHVDGISLLNGGLVSDALGTAHGGSSASSSPRLSVSPATKGYGLKKWRRIRRDVVKDASGGPDSGKALKRGLSGSGNPTRPVNLASMEHKNSGEVFVGSGNVIAGSSSDSRLAVGSAFTAGAGSENSVSEDRSSKSSTAASAPRGKNDHGIRSGYGRENNRTKAFSSKVAGSSIQRSQQGKGHVESSKKARGDKANAEKENSHSSMESDSRSSNLVFTNSLYSVTSNGKQSETLMNDDGENSDEAQVCERHDSEEIQTGYDHDTVEEVGYLSEDDSAVDASSQNNGRKSENNIPSKEKDPFVESMHMLQSVQDALGNVFMGRKRREQNTTLVVFMMIAIPLAEITKFGAIGRISRSPGDPVSTSPGGGPSSSFRELEEENVGQLLMLSENVRNLESRLGKVMEILSVKEAKVAELEDMLQRSKTENEKLDKDLKKKTDELENEVEVVLKQKTEAEFQFLTLRQTLQEWKAEEGNQQAVDEEKEAITGNEEEIVEKGREVEKKGELVKRGGEEEVLKIRKGICKVMCCLLIQLMLLMLVLWLLTMQLSPKYGVVVVPT